MQIFIYMCVYIHIYVCVYMNICYIPTYTRIYIYMEHLNRLAGDVRSDMYMYMYVYIIYTYILYSHISIYII